MTTECGFSNLAINVAFTIDGQIVITDNEGRLIKPVSVDEVFPIKTEQVLTPKSFTILRTTASPIRVTVVMENQVYCTIVDIDDVTGNVKSYRPC